MSCEYCAGFIGKDIVCKQDDLVKNSSNSYIDETDLVGVYKAGNRFQIFFKDNVYGDMEYPIKFDYCPKCGRKLE